MQSTVFQHLSRGLDIRRFQCVVGPFHHQNAVLSVGLDEDRRYAAGQSLNLLHMGCVDAKLLKVVDGSRTEQVVSQLAPP